MCGARRRGGRAVPWRCCWPALRFGPVLQLPWDGALPLRRISVKNPHNSIAAVRRRHYKQLRSASPADLTPGSLVLPLKSLTCKSPATCKPLAGHSQVSPAKYTMVRLSLAAGLAGLAGVAGFQRQAPPRPTTVLQYKKTAKEMRAKYPEGGKVPYVLTKDAPPHGVAGDVLKVNRGFANNYLAPQGLGEPASAEVIAAFEVKLAERAAAEAGSMMRPRSRRSSSSPRVTCPSTARRARTARSRPCRPRTCSRSWGSTRAPRSRSRRWTASATTRSLSLYTSR